MDISDPTQFHHRRVPSAERLMGAFPYAPTESAASTPSSLAIDELSEDDVVFSVGDNTDSYHSVTPFSSSASTPRHHLNHNQHRNHRNFGPLDSCGILAALPENETPLSGRSVSHFYHKASVSPSSSSSSTSSRLIPAIPKPPHDRTPFHSSAPSTKYLQSAPVNVPVLSQAMMSMRSRHGEFDEIDVEDEFDKDSEMLPPHEIVARSAARSPILSCSVLEGAGRTLKGRDLRQVRNAVLRQTGFMD